ncbi:SDR family NAD(P)-dependent oxidoreductase [Yinghuangia soli]|uniref:SDR family NAD(P)-dependent oxidoreductase n=1 Tax=Yinghuangia soli TaxID=2908204 RepID=A0AA41PXA1_9ACTN|nr:SDR family NAD(P)-dependent oxidoreductase [Yinghuangia soli]MCF2527575.1 SDR family NAD(P)-dependent oxidoreductase [Yinghuangia soli]
MAGRFEGKRVLVTGASSGIGAATAVAFAREGAVVGIAARRADRLADVLAECRTHTPGAAAFTVDLADLDGIEAFAAEAAKELGGVDVLVNNAGIPKRRRAAKLTPEDLHEVMAVNFEAPVRLTGALLPAMLERGDGHVVNLSSMGVHMFSFGVGAYAASKAAVELWTEALHLELAGTGVAAHLFVPGTTLTEFSKEREGNDPPFPVDPAAAATPEQVAAALLDCLGTDDFITYATERDAATAKAKNADPNAFLAQLRRR